LVRRGKGSLEDGTCLGFSNPSRGRSEKLGMVRVRRLPGTKKKSPLKGVRGLACWDQNSEPPPSTGGAKGGLHKVNLEVGKGGSKTVPAGGLGDQQCSNKKEGGKPRGEATEARKGIREGTRTLFKTSPHFRKKREGMSETRGRGSVGESSLRGRTHKTTKNWGAPAEGKEKNELRRKKANGDSSTRKKEKRGGILVEDQTDLPDRNGRDN